MANALKKSTGVASTTGTTIFTVPVGSTYTIIGCRVSNKDVGVGHTVSITCAGTYVSGIDTSLPASTALDIMSGSKIVMEAGDSLVVTSDADSVVDVYVSFLEQS